MTLILGIAIGYVLAMIAGTERAAAGETYAAEQDWGDD